MDTDIKNIESSISKEDLITNMETVDETIFEELNKEMPSKQKHLAYTLFYYIDNLYKYITDNKKYLSNDIVTDTDKYKSDLKKLIASLYKKFTGYNINVNIDTFKNIHMGVINSLFNTIIFNKYELNKLLNIKGFNESYKFGVYCPGCVCMYINEEEPKSYHGSAADTNIYTIRYYFNEDQLKSDIIKEIENKTIIDYISNTDKDDFETHKELYNNYIKNVDLVKQEIKEEFNIMKLYYSIDFYNLK